MTSIAKAASLGKISQNVVLNALAAKNDLNTFLSKSGTTRWGKAYKQLQGQQRDQFVALLLKNLQRYQAAKQEQKKEMLQGTADQSEQIDPVQNADSSPSNVTSKSQSPYVPPVSSNTSSSGSSNISIAIPQYGKSDAMSSYIAGLKTGVGTLPPQVVNSINLKKVFGKPIQLEYLNIQKQKKVQPSSAILYKQRKDPNSASWKLVAGSNFANGQWNTKKFTYRQQPTKASNLAAAKNLASKGVNFDSSLTQVVNMLSSVDNYLQKLGHQPMGPMSSSPNSLPMYLGRFINDSTGRLMKLPKPKAKFNKSKYANVYANKMAMIAYRWNQFTASVQAFNSFIRAYPQPAKYQAQYKADVAASMDIIKVRSKQFKNAIKSIINSTFTPYLAASADQKTQMVNAARGMEYQQFAAIVQKIAAAKQSQNPFKWKNYLNWRTLPGIYVYKQKKMMQAKNPFYKIDVKSQNALKQIETINKNMEVNFKNTTRDMRIVNVNLNQLADLQSQRKADPTAIQFTIVRQPKLHPFDDNKTETVQKNQVQYLKGIQMQQQTNPLEFVEFAS